MFDIVLNPKAAEAFELKEAEEEKKRSAKNKSSKIDITQLSWKDKERVLRVLFAKMNGIAMQGTDGNEMNKISASDYKLNESSYSPKDEESKPPVEEASRKDDANEDLHYSIEGSELGEGIEIDNEELESIHDTDLESLEDSESLDLQEHIRQRKDSHKEIIEKFKRESQQKLNSDAAGLSKNGSTAESDRGDHDNKDNGSKDKDATEETKPIPAKSSNSSVEKIEGEPEASHASVTEEIPSPHPPAEEPTNPGRISMNKKRSGSSLGQRSSGSITKLNSNPAIANKILSNTSSLGELLQSDQPLSPEMEEQQYIEDAKEIIKSEESLDKFIEDGMDNIKRSEEELRAQSQETFDEFLRRSYSQNLDIENPEDNEDINQQ